MLKLNLRSKKLLLLQRNELLSKKQIILRKKLGRFIFTNLLVNFFQKQDIEKKTIGLFKKELNIIKKYLPNKAKNIMDIGCGLGIINIFLNIRYKKKTNFFLLDKNKTDYKIKYGFNSNYESYNSLSETKRILLENKISEKFINLFDVDKKIKISHTIDLVISLKSMGYHYPFEKYLRLFNDCCTKDTVFIFDISTKNYDESHFKKFFGMVKVIHHEKSIHSLKRICCSKFKINKR